MKIKILSIFLFFCINNSVAQTKNIRGAFARVLFAGKYAGKKFTVEAAVRIVLIDSNAGAALWVRVDKSNNKMGFFNNMKDHPITSDKWKVYRISGTIDKDASYLVFGGLYHNKGIFYFDEFKLFIENDKAVPEEIPLINQGFEEDSLQSKQSWGYNNKDNPYPITLTTENVYSGKQCCQVDGSAIQQFGNNSNAGKFLQANGIKIYYEEYGEGQPLLLLHGNSSSISSFEKQIPEFSKYFHVYAIDTRGQGKSSEDGKKYTYDLFAEDVIAFIDSLKLDSVNILGWSDGGNTGLIMAMNHSNRIRKLVTMGAIVFIDKSVVDRSIFKMLKREKKELTGDNYPGSVKRLRLIELLLTEPKHEFFELTKITCPVLIVAGEHDVVKEAHTKSVAKFISVSTLFIAPGETHYFPSENPLIFNKTVLDFLNK